MREQSDAIIYDDTPEAGCFAFASAAVLIIALVVLLLITACGDAPELTDTWFIVPCPNGQTTIFQDGVRYCEPAP